MATLERRVEALESAGVGVIDFLLILRRIVTNVPHGEATHAQALGQSFVRDSAETEAQFIERIRAYALAQRLPGQHGVQVLLEEVDLDL